MAFDNLAAYGKAYTGSFKDAAVVELLKGFEDVVVRLSSSPMPLSSMNIPATPALSSP
jgi:hypothetical protein